MAKWVGVLVGTGLGFGATAALAQGTPAPAPAAAPPPAPIQIATPTDPVELGAFSMLDKHCARCHQEGRLGQKLKPAGRFGNVLLLKDIAVNANLIKPGNPDASLLFNTIAEQKMPFDVFQDYVEPTPPTPTAEEIQSLRAWITSLGKTTTASCESRKFIANQDVVSAISTDIQAQRDHRVRGTRYLTLTHLYNACTDEKLLDGYRQATVKLLNSLSSRSDVVKLETVDPEKTILRFNIDDLGWVEADWSRVIAAYPYPAKPESRLFGSVQQSSGTLLPFVRADWFAFAAAQPPLYTALLKLPDTLGGLEKKLGLNIQENIDKRIAQRAGFQHSGVSANNRLIERHTIPTGMFWTSYDFAGNKERQSLFKFPLGPHSAGTAGTSGATAQSGFEHDGGESIFSLPNGFQAYYLSTAAGKELTTGPTQIVRDPSRRDLAVTNGISCFGCHDAGIRKARDEIRKHVLADRSFPKEVRDAVEALYPPTEVMDELLERDMKRFRDATVKAGIDPALKINGIEIINAFSQKYEEALDLKHVAAEFGMKPEEFARAAPAAGPGAIGLLRRVEQGLVPRDTFEAEYAALLRGVTDEELLDTKALSPTAKVAKVESSAGQPTKGFDLALTADKPAYRQGDTAIISVKSAQTCFLTLINVDGSGEGTIIFPNRFQQDNRIVAGSTFSFGDSPAFKFRLADKGIETVIAECNATRPASRGFEASHKDGGFTGLGNYERRLTRQINQDGTSRGVRTRRISVEAGTAEPTTGVPGAVKTAPGQPGQPNQPDNVSRTAIKLDVR